MKATILLPDLQQEVTLQRGDSMFWIRRGVMPKWYAGLYIARGQRRIDDEQLQKRVADASADEMIDLLAYDDALVAFALKGSAVKAEDLSPEDYDVVLAFAKNGVVPDDVKGEQERAALETFRAES